ncbi:gluconokinase [Parvularcula maris]|uniref:gluconokinase n=1 Tax=Parvularcula maris TaxID=2965077 RepID=A0A9X2RJN9_9PROT|nr:gluconokinase [Parvularcula maris]MCQ8184938.1 gluconokinase [Parvularcula maris]
MASGETRLLVVMGPSGAGKSTVGVLAARRLGVPFYEGDAYHSAENVELIGAGIPLTMKERRPWIAAIGEAVGEDAPELGVLACSALNHEIRSVMEELIPAALTFAVLDVPEAELLERLKERQGHFAGPDLLRSQLDAMDDMDGIERLDGMLPPEELGRKAAELMRS